MAHSPRVWGWTARLAVHKWQHIAFPTRVGVDLVLAMRKRFCLGIPHACGGGPK